VRCNLKKPQRRRNVMEKKKRGVDRRKVTAEIEEESPFSPLCVLREFSAK